MSDTPPIIYLARHGETAWSLLGKHTGLTDIPLTERGEQNALLLGKRLAGLHFDVVYCSPLARARRTCELAGFADRSEVDRDLVEWNYGDYEGLRTVEIKEQRPDWELFRDGCPGGESTADLSQRADRVVARLRSITGTGLVFSSGHILRVLAARWLRHAVADGRDYALSTASLSALGYEHDEPVVRLWNETEYLSRND
jgi:probable phosphoglycerate mutase